MPRSADVLSGLSLARGTLDRAGLRRTDPQLLPALLGDPATQVLEIRDSRCRVTDSLPQSGDAALALRSPTTADSTGLTVFLGQDVSGTSYLGVVGGQEPEEEWQTLREVGVRLDDRDAGLFTTLQALANWHAVHTHCPRCGSPTEPVLAGWVRRCNNDGSEHYPRTDPAVIVSVVDNQDRLLLARGPSWPEGTYSVLAGFVEPGESFEAAVVREVAEEVGLVVDSVRYLGNQPWPFPCSLMVGFTARARDDRLSFADEEIVHALWLSREELARRLDQRALRISPRLSIARALVEHWYGEPLHPPVEVTSMRST